MAHDLFGDLVSRPPSIRSRRTPVVVASVIIHTLALVATIVVSLVATDVLPSPRQALEFYDTPVGMADIPLPPPPPRAPAPAPQPDASPVNSGAAPLIAPEGIAPESGVEHAVSSSSDVGLIVGMGTTAPDGFGWREQPPPPPAPPEPVRLHSGIQAPVKAVHVAPIYPPIALAVHAQGVVILETTIDEKGLVVNVKVLRSIPLLDGAAVEAVRQWRFSPARLNGEAISVIMTVTVDFRLQ
jgi:protein TonB